MNDIMTQHDTAIVPDVGNNQAFADLCAQVGRTVAESSARIYQQTFSAWSTWCAASDVDLLDLRPVTVIQFLTSGDTTKTTRQRQLSALRKLAQMLYILRPSDDHRRIVEALKVTKAPVTADAGTERARRALTPAQADRMLRMWEGSADADVRNRALVAVLLLGGLRRSEAAALRWRDVDFENGILQVRHGKGDKARDVPLAGDTALERLRAWQLVQPLDYEWVFGPVDRSGRASYDQPISGTDVYRIWCATANAAGVESKPHDARRTFITEALTTGAQLVTVQKAAGHAKGETTLGYAQAVNARAARKELRFRYGS